MKNALKILNPAALILMITFIFLILTNPTACTKGAVNGILLCGYVIIPSLFPFTVCVMFILKSGVLRLLKPLSRITQRIFGIDAELFSVMLLSFIGGYPVGARLLSETAELKKITPKNAGIMLNYCINAGPAFIVLAVGSGIIGSKKIGYILLLSHILASFLIALISKKLIGKEPLLSQSTQPPINFADNFVLSTSTAASSVINICSYVILFSAINSYIDFYSENIHLLKNFSYLLEVTNAVSLTDNIYLISFLLGFSGISVWCQVLSAARKIKINYPLFLIFRILHGVFSTAFTYLILKIFSVTVSTFSNGKSFDFSAYHTSLAVGISIVCLGITFIISLYSKKKGGNILEDLV